MRVVAYLLFYWFGLNVLLAESDKAGEYHHSYLYEEEVLYIGDNLAIYRNVSYYGSDIDEPRIRYTLYEAEWGGSPELSMITGNISHAVLVNHIKGMNWDSAHKIFYGKGISPSRAGKGNEEIYFMIFAASKELISRKTEIEIKNLLKEKGVTEFNLVGSEMYFRLMVENAKDFGKKK